MFKARPAGPASAVDREVGPSSDARRQQRRGASGVRAFGAGLSLLVRLVHVVVSLVVLIMLAGILFALLKANPTNSIVSEVHGWGRWLAGPFNGMFSFHTARVAIAVNWGIAAVIYLFAGGLIARLIGHSHSSSISDQEGS
jgi:hypothetical protein